MSELNKTPQAKLEAIGACQIAVSKDCYLLWKDHADLGVWSSYPLWSALSDKQKLWWCEFTADVYERHSRIEV